MAKTELIRIAIMNDDERAMINFLSPDERKGALLKAGQCKLHDANSRLLERLKQEEARLQQMIKEDE